MPRLAWITLVTSHATDVLPRALQVDTVVVDAVQRTEQDFQDICSRSSQSSSSQRTDSQGQDIRYRLVVSELVSATAISSQDLRRCQSRILHFALCAYAP